MNDKLEKLRCYLINSSIGISAVRNQGNGIADPIRRKLKDVFYFEDFFKHLKSDNEELFKKYLDKLTLKIVGIDGVSNNENEAGTVKWGTARKCVNILLRGVAYNGFMWEIYNIKQSDFLSDGLMGKLELPMDNHVVAGIKEDCKEYGIAFNREKYPSYSIISSNKSVNRYYQDLARVIGRERKLCRVDLDLYYWRKK